MSEENKRRARRGGEIRSARDVVAELTEQNKPSGGTPPKKPGRRFPGIDISPITEFLKKAYARLKVIPYWIKIGIAALLFAFFALLFSSTNPVVNNTVITVVGRDSAIDNYKILVISDLNGRRFGDKQVQLLNQINQLSYSIVFCLGDMVGEDGDPEPFYELLEGMPAGRQVYFIAGDSDPSPYVSSVRNEEAPLRQLVLNDWILGAEARGAIYVDAPMKIEINGVEVWLAPASMLNVDAGETLALWKEQVEQEKAGYLAGIAADTHSLPFTSYRLDRAQILNDTITEMTDGEMLIALTHVPCSDEFISSTATLRYDSKYLGVPDIVFAAHYCGGVMNLPLIGAFYVPDSTLERFGWLPSQDRVSGLREVDNTQVFVTRGLGTCGDIPLMPFRLFNNPEIAVITLSGTMPQNMLGN